MTAKKIRQCAEMATFKRHVIFVHKVLEITDEEIALSCLIVSPDNLQFVFVFTYSYKALQCARCYNL